MDKNTEIRKLSALAVFKLGQMLDIENTWQKVMAMIPSDPNDLESEAKYTLQHIKLIQSASEKKNISCTQLLLEEWGTSGKVRPTLNTLLQILIKAQFYCAAEYVAVSLLNDEPPERPSCGPAAPVAVDLPPLPDEMSSENSSSCNGILHFPYSALEEVTNGFDETPFARCEHDNGTVHFVGRRLGSGAFGTVYYGELKNGNKVAVKRLSQENTDLTIQFENEIKTLSEYRHANLMPLLGFSCDTDNHCLVYEFMSNGSLLDRLQVKASSSGINPVCKGGKEINEVLCETPSNRGICNVIWLPWRKRIELAADVCEGIHFLHTSKKFPLIHRDVKSANILLDDRMNGRLGDFGLVKVKPNLSESKMVTSNVFGTSAYMAPEAFRGDVSVKMDVFSFGVVLLELLTGLPPYDENREGRDLVTYVEDVVEDSIEFLLDRKGGEWDVEVAQEIFVLSQSCLEEKKSRPVIGDVRERLRTVLLRFGCANDSV